MKCLSIDMQFSKQQTEIVAYRDAVCNLHQRDLQGIIGFQEKIKGQIQKIKRYNLLSRFSEPEPKNYEVSAPAPGEL